MKYTFLFILVFTRISFCQQLNCSAFITQGNKILLAKNLDFELGEGLVLFNPAGIEKNSISNYGTSWNSKFASITFNMFGLNLPLGGINSQGLAIEELSTYPVQYKDSGETKLNEFELIQYILDNFATVNEIERNLDKISVDRFYFNIHYIICDSFGNNAVLEYHNGSAKYITGNEFKYKVLTNVACQP